MLSALEWDLVSDIQIVWKKTFQLIYFLEGDKTCVSLVYLSIKQLIEELEEIPQYLSTDEGLNLWSWFRNDIQIRWKTKFEEHPQQLINLEESPRRIHSSANQ